MQLLVYPTKQILDTKYVFINRDHFYQRSGLVFVNCHFLHLSNQSACVCKPWACPHHNSFPVQAGITLASIFWGVGVCGWVFGSFTSSICTTVETLYNTVNFCWSTHKRHSIARPKGRGMGCLLWVQRATYCVDSVLHIVAGPRT